MFSKSLLVSGLALAVLGFSAWLRTQPNRLELADTTVAGRADAIVIEGALAAPIAGASLWRLTAPDPRFGGISALGVDAGELIALSDSGAVIGFAPPVSANQPVIFGFHDLPDGPGPVHRKAWRDSESLLRDPGGRGWWVGFETRHSLWLFDPVFSRVLGRRSLKAGWRRNRGAEALVAGSGGKIYALPEDGGPALGPDGARGSLAPRGSADAARLPDGRLALLVRRVTPKGFVSEVRISGVAGRPALGLRLPLGPLANAEAITAATRADGGTRLWIATDDNFKPWMRTYLLALDLAEGV